MSSPEAKQSLTEFFQATVDEFPGDVTALGDFSIERGAELIRADRNRRATAE